MSQVRLVMGDHQILLDGSVIADPNEIPMGTSLQILLNYGDLDNSSEPLPTLGWWDRYRYLRHRTFLESQTLLRGFEAHEDILIEVSCPLDETLNKWLEVLVARQIRIQSIQPLFPMPVGKYAYTLVVTSDGGPNGCRYILYEGSKPLFTRMTPQPFNAQDAITTLSYIRNQFLVDNLVVECHMPSPDFDQLADSMPTDIITQLIPKQDRTAIHGIGFRMPTPVRHANSASRLRLFDKLGASFAIVLFGFGLWQSSVYKVQQEELVALEEKAQESVKQINLLKAELPLDKLLPPEYRQKLQEASPIDLFRHISGILNNDVTISALKWENTAEEERLLLHARVLGADEDADQTIEVIQDFKNSLVEALPKFTVEIQSLPHKSGDQETFTGSASSQDLVLAGDKEKAIIQLIRKKT